ncbi:hypothetical protein [Streptomyces sp. AM8-1-1]|uniref:hypothetical protein n=1 Tax=Streptomyces sp. AM8-1-1 TaxID=3075825 RepID=UPI0028C48524|nr:hypothetical protein [Streptomyces sp. AM8-1-1]WNO73380.1 hypothetical protein RPQ07_17850 [Streptomyces sp. AM8-1-1]
MSRIAQVIVLAAYEDEVMEPLTRWDDSRSWKGTFEPLGLFVGGWVIEFHRERPRSGLLKHLGSLPWTNPGGVQVLIHDEEDDCFGLWMIHDGRLVEVSLPRTQRFHSPVPSSDEFPPSPGYLWRTDTGSTVPADLSAERQDPRPAW